MNLKDLLEQEPKARERKYKNRAIAKIIQSKYTIQISTSALQEIVGEVLTLDRSWRKTLEDNPHLRGTDYKDKDELEQKAMINLGFSVGHHQDVKKLKGIY